MASLTTRVRTRGLATLRRLLGSVAGAGLIASLGLSLSWLLTSRTGFDRLQAGANVLALVAAIAAIPAERWAAARERRTTGLVALLHELERNRQVMDQLLRVDDTRPLRREVYPRLLYSAADFAITNGALSGAGDYELLMSVLRWRDEVREANRRLDLTELRMFSSDSIGTSELGRLREALQRQGGVLHGLDRQLRDLDQSLRSALQEATVLTR